MIDGLVYLLWLSSAPFSAKILSNCFGEEVKYHSLRERLERLYKKGFILKIKKKRKVFFFPKEEFGWLSDDSMLIKRKRSFQKWNGLWWIIIYDIPEKIRMKRNSLRIFLKDLGFAKVKESCWISPYNFSSQIHAFCNKENILRYICLYEGRFFAGRDIKDTVEDIWKLNVINNRYAELIRKCKDGVEILETNDLSFKKVYKMYSNLYEELREIIDEDPFLPMAFLEKWLRKKAEVSFDRFARIACKRFLHHM